MAFFQHGIGEAWFPDSVNFRKLKLAAHPFAARRPLKSLFFNGLPGAHAAAQDGVLIASATVRHISLLRRFCSKACPGKVRL